MAVMLMYLSSLWGGTANPLWPHIVLLLVSIIAAFAVGFGIKFESSKYSAAVHAVATWLILGGIAVESACTVLLFVVDERISSAQQEKIIALEARPWTKEQYDAIQSLKGTIPAVAIFSQPRCIECQLFANSLVTAFHDAGAEIYEQPDLDLPVATGIAVYLPDAMVSQEPPIIKVLNAAGLSPSWLRWSSSYASKIAIRSDIPIVTVGERFPRYETFPYFPPGNSSYTIHSLRK